MAKAIIEKVIKEGATKKGTKFYNVLGTIDGQTEVFDVWFMPEFGKEYEGELKTTEYGKSFSTPRQGGNSGGRGGYRRDPETEARIVRQNALGHAMNMATTLANLYMQAAPEDQKIEAFDTASSYLIPSKIMRAAELFTNYSLGTLKPSSPNKPVTPPPAPAATQLTTEPAASSIEQAARDTFPEATVNEPAPTPPAEVDDDTLPF